MPYELRYGTVHCTGRITYSHGTVATRDDAESWCRGARGDENDAPQVPETDPLRWCPVRHCHMKRQRPWRAFREVTATDAPPAGQEAS